MDEKGAINCICGDPRESHASEHGPCLYGATIADLTVWCPCEHFTPDDGTERTCSPYECHVAALAAIDADPQFFTRTKAV